MPDRMASVHNAEISLIISALYGDQGCGVALSRKMSLALNS